MSDGHLLRLLEVVRRELGADDARAEIGGKNPADPRKLWTHLPGGWRLVVLFDAAPEDREAQTDRLRQLAETFFRSATHHLDGPAASASAGRRHLNDELAALAARTGALCAVVIDGQSPMLWGCSEEAALEGDLDSALVLAQAATAAERAGVELEQLLGDNARALAEQLQAQGLEPEQAVSLAREAARMHSAIRARSDGVAWHRHLLTSRAIAAVRAREAASDAGPQREAVRHETFGYLSRSFAQIYRLITVFDHTFSELHAEAAVLHALPIIERLVLALPPVDPPPRRGEVVRLKPRSG